MLPQLSQLWRPAAARRPSGVPAMRPPWPSLRSLLEHVLVRLEAEEPDVPVEAEVVRRERVDDLHPLRPREAGQRTIQGILQHLPLLGL